MAAQRPTSLGNHTLQELFPSPPSQVEMLMYFGGLSWVLPNLLENLVPQSITYNDQKPYVSASATVCNTSSGALPDDWESTKRRTLLYYLAAFGSIRDFIPTNANNYDKIVSSDILQAWQTTVVAPDTAVIPNGDHWAKMKLKPNTNSNTIPTWYKYASTKITRERDDIKKYWIEVARDKVWPLIIDEINPQNVWNTKAFWQFHSAVPGRIVSMMLYFIRQNPNQRPRIVKFLLGTNSNHIDIDALYAASNQGGVITTLINQIEYACAHVLNQVLENYVLLGATAASTRIVAPNLRHLAASSTDTAFLEANVHHFPIM